ncbi:hypothetical protein B0A48_07370 [Cryoendolithus antarcticus]|uniref:Heterokaryon incompatibility domain-containing protein n=1 Tax=Cryoendolithus antarcticus TaxID=1507870 RepID=A0A1V8T8D8_9PEZI|nr:hypothetical protein B0A48_07370 [Cryoendolithus antarcticus]
MDDIDKAQYAEVLRSLPTLMDLMKYAGNVHMFWFMQRREAFLSEECLGKWNRKRLDQYVLLPIAFKSVIRSECHFVSHFWQQSDSPDPNGHSLQLVQKQLAGQAWSYVWIDWTCLPQAPRSAVETVYFDRALSTMPAIIQEASFISTYPSWEPRLWILFEVAHFGATGDPSEDWISQPDVAPYIMHMFEMVQSNGVRAIIDRYGYKCTQPFDQALITFWLELLILFGQIGLDKADVCKFVTNMTFQPGAGHLKYTSLDASFELWQFEGLLLH